MGNEWQTVQSSKRKKPLVNEKEPGAEVLGNGNATDHSNLSAAKSVLEKNKSSSTARQTQNKGKVSAMNGNGSVADIGAFGGLKDDSPPPSTPDTGSDKESDSEVQIQKKPKKPKVKKVATFQVAATLKAADFETFFAEVEEKYSRDEDKQLEIVADHFLNTFRECDIPFNKTVLEQPLSKSVDFPAKDVPFEIRLAAMDFFRKKSAQSLADFTCKLVHFAFEGWPEADPGKVTPPKAKVGLLIILSVVLRSRPEVLLLISPYLLDNAKRFSSRLPLLLWIIHQGTRARTSIMAVAVWTRVLLPQLFGQELPSNAQKAATPRPVHKLDPSGAVTVLKYMKEVLHGVESEKGGINWLGPDYGGDPAQLFLYAAMDSSLLRAAQEGIAYQDNGKRVVETAIPPGAWNAYIRSCCHAEPSFGPTRARMQLSEIWEALVEMYIAGLGTSHGPMQEAVQLALETAAIGAEAQGSSEHVDERTEQAATLLVNLIRVNPYSATRAWESKHKQQIRGSAAVLRYLSSSSPNPSMTLLLANSHRRSAFLTMLKHLQERHQSLLSTGKSWQQTRAQVADTSCEGLRKTILTERRNIAVGSAFLLSAFVALVALFLLRQEFMEGAIERFCGLVGHLEPIFKHRIAPAVDSLQKSSANMFQSTFSPLLRQVKGQLKLLAAGVLRNRS